MNKVEFFHIVKANLTLKYLRRVYWSVWTDLYSKRVDDVTFLQRAYKKATGRELNLDNPVRYTEKLQWLKLFYRDPLMTRCSDKQELKEYLKEIGHGDMAVKTIAIYDSVDDIDISALPDQFVMKATHGSGWNLICTDKSTLNWKKWKRLFGIWMKQNPHWFGREWNYKNITPRIIVEEYLEDDSGELRDYKVFCFNGRAEYMQIDENRSSAHKRKFYDRLGNDLGIRDSHGHNGEQSVSFGDKQIEMLALAEVFAKPFPSVRIDFYEFSGKIYVGEFTFFDGSGFYSFDPDEIDYIWGEKLELPVPNHNIELFNELKPQKL